MVSVVIQMMIRHFSTIHCHHMRIRIRIRVHIDC